MATVSTSVTRVNVCRYAVRIQVELRNRVVVKRWGKWSISGGVLNFSREIKVGAARLFEQSAQLSWFWQRN